MMPISSVKCPSLASATGNALMYSGVTARGSLSDVSGSLAPVSGLNGLASGESPPAFVPQRAGFAATKAMQVGSGTSMTWVVGVRRPVFESIRNTVRLFEP